MDDECGGDKWLWCLRLWYFRSLGDIWLLGGVRSDGKGLLYDFSLFEQLLKVVFNWWVDGH